MGLYSLPASTHNVLQINDTSCPVMRFCQLMVNGTKIRSLWLRTCSVVASSSQIMSKVQHHYAKYVTSGGDGPTVLKGRAATLGYDSDFVPESIYNNPNLFRASCGSGCPLPHPVCC